MALKSSIVLITIEFLLVAYILLDVYASIFLGLNNIVVSLEDRIARLNATNEDPKIVGIGNFAVNEYNRLTNSDLKFQSVVRSLFIKSSYMLLIQVTDGTFSKSKQYAAIIAEQWDRMSLITFEEYMQSAI